MPWKRQKVVLRIFRYSTFMFNEYMCIYIYILETGFQLTKICGSECFLYATREFNKFLCMLLPTFRKICLWRWAQGRKTEIEEKHPQRQRDHSQTKKRSSNIYTGIWRMKSNDDDEGKDGSNLEERNAQEWRVGTFIVQVTQPPIYWAWHSTLIWR